MTTAPPVRPADAAVAEAFFDALVRADEQAAVDLALGLVDAGTPAQDVLLHLVGPAQVRVGQLWADGDWSVAQEHAATCINERVVAAVGVRSRAPGQRGHVVLGCLDGEWHSLPARIAGEVLRLAGWRVTFLGASVPPAHLISYLHEHGPDLVAVSCALPIHLPQAHRTIAAAQRTGTPVLAGGPGFGPDGRWAVRLGVDAWVPTAADAVVLLESPSWSDRAVPGRTADGGSEYAGLRDRRAELVRAALDRLGGASPLADPDGSGGGNGLDGQAHDDVGQLVDYLAAAVYLCDADLFTEHVRWLGAVLSARGLPRTGVAVVLDVLAAELHDFPVAQRCLREGCDVLAAV
ncbi:cobalamin B12-binding domain-containing protein [Pseudonocardia cypriaca]|uniref:Methanogenic corrinoid protein MtbC1 n=1 Tax=Pseudonocardia cypriaca TaxID=882449 RepID=A0A543GJG9_9PSEU|nr:cobalamin-dependent protein [Pseudonocardia cypriaca]TQM46164.1 methanogenic corrinoid protein MtbC1 [Pseudonocardia cypriaca]